MNTSLQSGLQEQFAGSKTCDDSVDTFILHLYGHAHLEPDIRKWGGAPTCELNVLGVGGQGLRGIRQYQKLLSNYLFGARAMGGVGDHTLPLQTLHHVICQANKWEMTREQEHEGTSTQGSHHS